jgi:hypothetical protein
MSPSEQALLDFVSSLSIMGKRPTLDSGTAVPCPFGIVKAAQARGDFQVLAECKHRALRVHLGSDAAAGLTELTPNG